MSLLKALLDNVESRVCKFYQETKDSVVSLVMASELDHVKVRAIESMNMVRLIFAWAAMRGRRLVNEYNRRPRHRPGPISLL
jgi:hypothetical protein